MINNIDVNKIVVSNKISCGKTILDILLDIKMVKKLDLYEYSFQNWVHIEEMLIKLKMSFLKKKRKIVRKISWNLKKSEQHYQKRICIQ